MSSISSIPPAGQSLQNVWDRIGRKADQLATEVASGDIADGSFVQTVVELKSLQLQAEAAGLVFKTLNEVAGDLLSRPRK